MSWKSDFCNGYKDKSFHENENNDNNIDKIECEIHKNRDVIKIKTPDDTVITDEFPNIAEMLRKQNIPEFSFNAEITKRNKTNNNELFGDESLSCDEAIVTVVDVISLNGSSLSTLNTNQKKILLQRDLKEDRRLKFKKKEEEDV
ncbi:MAG: hypothetical protein ACLFSQ_03850 [Candidatus Zixiibacteriota bacterium]